MRIPVALFLSVLLFQNLSASDNERSIVLQSGSEQRVVTGNLQIDFFSKTDLAMKPMLQDEAILPVEQQRKSPWLAAGLSAVLPGAGEFYAESYWKAAAFLAVDIAAWVIAYTNDKKGDDKTAFFQNFADQNWDPVRYAEYSITNFIGLAEVPTERKDVIRNNLITNRNAPSPSQRVDWQLLNEFEDYISRSQTGKYYSHRLPNYGEQQYFELIGKYPQYNPGWNDAPANWTYSETNLSPNNIYYSGERGKANDYYSRATTFVTIAIVNHVLSALDAAWTASMFNKRLHASMEMQTIPTRFGLTQVPVARVQYSF